MSHGVADGAETWFGDWRGLGHACGLCCGVWGSRDVPWRCRAGARQVGLAPRRKKMRLIPNSAGQGMGLSRRSARPSSPGRRGRCGDAFLRCAVSAARTGMHIPALAAASSPGGSQFPGLPAPPVGHHRGAEPFLSLCSSRWGHRELPNSEQPSCHGDGRTCGEPYPCSAPLGPLPLCSDGAGLPPGPAGLFLTVCHVLPEHN